MSTVLALRINRQQAVLVADESTWHLGHVFGYRRTNYGDSLASLIPPGAARELAGVYGGVGFPSFHDEVVRRIRRELAGGESIRENKLLAQRSHEAFVASHQRLVDDKLRFDYGFTLAELNARRYQLDGATREIQQEAVIGAARAAAAGSARGNAFVRIFSSQGLLVSRDLQHGVQCWYLEPNGSHMGFATPLAVVGDGNAIATHMLAECLERRHVGRRRVGFTLEEGLYLAMRIATEIRYRVGTMGGYLQVMLVDEAGVREVVSDAAHLAVEVMRAHGWGFLKRADAEELVVDLLHHGARVDAVERQLFARAGSGAASLERYLMGFKAAASPTAQAVDPSPAAPPRGRRTRAAGKGRR